MIACPTMDRRAGHARGHHAAGGGYGRVLGKRAHERTWNRERRDDSTRRDLGRGRDGLGRAWRGTGGDQSSRSGAGSARCSETISLPGASDAIVRVDYVTFDRVAGCWDYVSMDTRAPVGIMPAWSFDRGSDERILLTFAPFPLVGSGAGVGGQMLRMDQVIVDRGPTTPSSSIGCWRTAPERRGCISTPIPGAPLERR